MVFFSNRFGACAAACEFRRKHAARLLPLLAAAWLLASHTVAAQGHATNPVDRPEEAVSATQQPPVEGDAHAPQAGQAHADEEHGESIWGQIGKITNFVILVGGLAYLVRKPLSNYITTRRAQVRADLVAADEMKRAAAAQMAEMDAKLKALPRELDELKARGQQEIAAEEQRIRELAEVERVRLLEQARRDIEQQVRLARRELVQHAAGLAVGVAEQKIRQQITDVDQQRLVDRYLGQVQTHE